MLNVARDLGRLPSELFAVGSSNYRLKIKGSGILGRWLEFDGELQDTRQPIMLSEYLELLGLYLLEKEEQEEARGNASNG